jgi:hypothetical protein
LSWGETGVHLVRRPLTGLLYQPRMIGDECRAVGGMSIGRGNRSTRRKPASVPLCPPQIPHDLTWARTGAVEVGSRRLTAWAMARPRLILNLHAFRGCGASTNSDDVDYFVKLTRVKARHGNISGHSIFMPKFNDNPETHSNIWSHSLVT